MFRSSICHGKYFLLGRDKGRLLRKAFCLVPKHIILSKGGPFKVIHAHPFRINANLLLHVHPPFLLLLLLLKRVLMRPLLFARYSVPPSSPSLPPSRLMPTSPTIPLHLTTHLRSVAYPRDSCFFQNLRQERDSSSDELMISLPWLPPYFRGGDISICCP